MMHLRTLLAAVALLAGARAALAQGFDECGELERGALNCWMLHADDGRLCLINPNPTGWNSGDRVRVVGTSQSSCTNFCQVTTTCVFNAAYSACSSAVCRADFDGSGQASVQDIFAFLSAYFGPPVGGPSPPSADFDQNGSVTVNDIFAFLAAYFTGCD